MINVSIFKSNKQALKKEVVTMKQLSTAQSQLIKFIEFDTNSPHSNVVIIVTDDHDLHSLLLREWPADSFGGGAQMIKQVQKERADTSLELIIRGVDLDIELDEYTDQLTKQGITSASRVVKKADNSHTSVVKLKVENKETYDRLANRHITIDCFRFKTETQFRPVQCYRCQKFYHD